MAGASVAILLLLLGIGAIAGVVVATVLGYTTIAIVVGIVSGAFFAGRVC